MVCFENSYIIEFHGVASKRHFKDSSFWYCSDVMRDLLQRRVNMFLSVWNKLRRSLDTNGEYPSLTALFFVMEMKDCPLSDGSFSTL